MRLLPALLLFVAVLSATPVKAGSSNSLMDVSTDGKLLACSNRDSGTLTVVDLATHTVKSEFKVGHHPEGISFIGDSHRVAIAVYDDDVIVFADADKGEVTGKTGVFDEPYGIVSNKAGTRLYVTLEYPGRIAEIDGASGKLLREFNAGSFPRGIAISSDDKQVVTAEYLTAHVRAFDIARGVQVDEWLGGPTDNLARQVVLHPKRPKAYYAHIRSRIETAHGAGSIFPYLGCADLVQKEETRRRRIALDSFIQTLVTANPWEVALSPDGSKLYVVCSGTNDMYATRTVDDDYTEIANEKYLQVGTNPRAVRVSPDGKSVFVYNALDFNVMVFDAATMTLKQKIDVTKNPMSNEIWYGKVLFYSALQPMVGRRWISCSSCHPDGQADGKTWHNPEGLRATPPLGGLAFTHPQHWSADRDETQDFEHTIRGPLMQGYGLIRGKVNPSLGAPNKGLSKDLDALTAYTNSHRFTLSPHAKGGLSEAAKRGRDLFNNETVGCAKCHSGPFYTDSQSGKPSVMHDVGTGNEDPGEKMGPKYDTPTLHSLYRTAPYLHHGKAATLTDVLTTANKGDKHGKTSHLSKEQVADLVEFLKALPYEDPEPQAEKAGIKRVAN